MKRSLKETILFLGILICLLLPSFRVTAEKDKTVRIGYIDYGSFIEQDENGRYRGFGVEYLEEITKYTGWKYEYVYDTWDQCLKMLQNGEIDFLGTAQRTPEREKIYDFADISNGMEQMILYTRLDNDEIYYNDYQAFEGKRVGMLVNSFQTEYFEKYAELHGFSCEEVAMNTEEEMVESLKSGDTDLMVGGSLAMHTDLKVVGKEGAEPFYFMTYKGNGETLKELNLAMQEIQTAHPYYSQELAKKYYGDSVITSKPQFTREEAEYIQRTPAIRIGCLSDCYPISRWNETEEKAEGIVVEIMNNLIQEIGIQATYVPIPVGVNPGDYLEAGFVDVVLPITIDAYEGRETMRFSDPLLSTSFAPVMRQDEILDTQKNYRVAFVSDYKECEEIVGKYLTCVTPVYFDSVSECIHAVKEGRADLYFDNYYILAYQLKSPFYETLQESYGYNYPLDYGVGVLKEEELLLSIFNKAISAMAEESIQDIINRDTLNDNYQYNAWENMYANRYVVIAVMLLIVLMITFFLMISVLQKRNVRKIEEKNRELEAANRAKSNFLSNMSHELRTPMNAIIGMTKLAMEEDHPENTRDYLLKIDDSSQYLLGILNDVLDMSRIERGKLELHPEWVYPSSIFEACIPMLTSAMREKKIHFEYPRTENFRRVQYFVDPLRCKQVFMNILNNAVKFTPEGGSITLGVENRILDDTRCQDVYTVRDTGCGMSAEFLERIFTPFEQEKNLYVNAVQGTGLGLALVKEIVTAMGGSIEVESRLDEGSVFTITLTYKYRAAKVKEREKKEAQKSRPKEAGLEGWQVLLVDDHPLNREIGRKLLEKRKIVVTTAADGKEAVEMFAKSSEGYFRAVLMDIRMPVMGGLDAARAIRALDRKDAATVPIIAMTANAFDEDIKASLDAGMNAHLAKPINPELLYETLCTYEGKERNG